MKSTRLDWTWSLQAFLKDLGNIYLEAACVKLIVKGLEVIHEEE